MRTMCVTSKHLLVVVVSFLGSILFLFAEQGNSLTNTPPSHPSLLLLQIASSILLDLTWL